MLSTIVMIVKTHLRLGLSVFLGVFLVVMGAVVWGPKQYQAEALVFVDEANPLAELMHVSDSAERHPINYGHLALMQSAGVAAYAADQLEATFPRHQAFSSSDIQQRLEVTLVEGATLLQMKFQDTSSEYARSALEELIHGYEQSAQELAKAAAKRSQHVVKAKKELLEKQQARLQKERDTLGDAMLEETSEAAVAGKKYQQVQAELVHVKKALGQLQRQWHILAVDQLYVEATTPQVTFVPPTVQMEPRVFAWPRLQAVQYGLLIGLLAAIGAMVLAEWWVPQVRNLTSLLLLGSIADEDDTSAFQRVYQNIALLFHTHKFRSITLFHLSAGCDLEAGYPYSPGVVAYQMASDFSKRSVKTLLVDFTGSYLPVQRTTQPGDAGYRLYKYDHLHVLSPTRPSATLFDPEVLRLLPDADAYELIMYNAILPQEGLVGHLPCELSEATVLGISQLLTPPPVIRQMQRIAKEREIELLGSVLLP